MKLTVVIPVYNASATITEQMEALSEQTWEYPWEVIVVDNGSTDDSIKLVKNFQDKIENLRIVEAYERKGAAYARNVGVDHSSGEFLAFCDADDVVGKNWVKNIGDALLKYDFVACKWDLNRLNDSEVVNSRGDGQSNGLMNFSIIKFLPHAGGGSIGIKKSIHEKVNGFDIDFINLQDTDYCWRVQLTGVELVFIPEAVVHIRIRENMSGTLRQFYNWGEYSALLYKKYQPYGMPVKSAKSSMLAVYGAVITATDLLKEDRRSRWLTKFARILGRVKGSVKYKTFVI